MVSGQYVPDFLFQDDFCPLWPAGQAQHHLAGLLRGWHADASGGPLTAVLKALLDRLAAVQPRVAHGFTALFSTERGRMPGSYAGTLRARLREAVQRDARLRFELETLPNGKALAAWIRCTGSSADTFTVPFDLLVFCSFFPVGTVLTSIHGGCRRRCDFGTPGCGRQQGAAGAFVHAACVKA